MIAFGPVPSRRLGHSLGINHIPPKHCPYSCVYCQVGRTTALETVRRPFYPVDQILQGVEKKVSDSIKLGQAIDYLTLVPDGEPTLDSHLDKIIQELRTFQIPIAVISNASLIDQEGVQEALLKADWVSLKVDAVIEADWRKINRPHRRLSLPVILTNILRFRDRFQGEFITETMLVANINDSEAAIQRLSDYLVELQPFKSYLSIPTRPPAESWVEPPSPDSIRQILRIISERVPFIDLLLESEAPNFISTGNLLEDILSITAVHPLREEALRHMIIQAGADWSIIEELLVSRQITCLDHRGERYYLRSFAKHH
ncbi:MAG: radical SAM protein [Chloroflexi bacterium]|nr:radical SAM protein [Chloroflexota bacterium]